MVINDRNDRVIWAIAWMMLSAVMAPSAGAMNDMPPMMTMPVPDVPTSIACQAPVMQVEPGNPLASRPLGISMADGTLSMMIGLGEFAGPIDIYLMVQRPDGQRMFLDGAGQWWMFPPEVVPWRVHSAAGVFAEVFRMPMTPGLMAGMYGAYVAVVPAGMDPTMFSLNHSPYYLWCFNQTL